MLFTRTLALVALAVVSVPAPTAAGTASPPPAIAASPPDCSGCSGSGQAAGDFFDPVTGASVFVDHLIFSGDCFDNGAGCGASPCEIWYSWALDVGANGGWGQTVTTWTCGSTFAVTTNNHNNLGPNETRSDSGWIDLSCGCNLSLKVCVYPAGGNSGCVTESAQCSACVD